VNWEEAISLGEKQRLAIARLLFHRPRFAILDECTSACSMEMEQRLFRICNELEMSYITISHRPALIAYHDQILTIGDGQAGFTLRQLGTKRERQERLKQQQAQQGARGAAVDQGAALGDAEQSIKLHQEKRSEPYAALQQADKAAAEEERTGAVNAAADAGAKATAATAKGTLKRVHRLLLLAMPNGEGLPTLGSILACVVGKTALHVVQNHFVGRMLFYLPQQDVRNFFRVTMCSVLVAVGLAGVGEAGLKWHQRKLMMQMRTRLTRSFLGRFYRDLAFYHMVSVDSAVADPEQRLADDLDAFSESMSMVLAGALKTIRLPITGPKSQSLVILVKSVSVLFRNTIKN
jgi:ABC-type uncharacterized transport system fused permease/ATPase subunit